jgi:hypothetical protein
VKKYLVEVIRWEPQAVLFEIESENSLNAKADALARVRSGDFEYVETGTCIPIRTTLLKCKRLK